MQKPTPSRIRKLTQKSSQNPIHNSWNFKGKQERKRLKKKNSLFFPFLYTSTAGTMRGLLLMFKEH